MTREEAIRTLLDGKWWEWCNIPPAEDDEDAAAFHDALDMAIAALRAQQGEQQNDPLTLDELREMDGEPVWVRSIPDACEGCWMCIYGKRCENPNKIVHFEDYGKSWLAYRRKP